MNQETANYIMQRMSKYLDNSQMIKLKDTLDESLRLSELQKARSGVSSRPRSVSKSYWGRFSPARTVPNGLLDSYL